MQFGILTPMVSLNPREHAAWEVTAGVEELVTVAQAADGLGYHHLTCSEHVAVPLAAEGRRGTRYWDPASTLSFVAARTQRIKLATHVLVLGYHHPLDIVKRFGTLDLVSGGRLILGLGVGSLEEEFDLLGAEFADRGARADDAVRAIRASFGHRTPSYGGSHYRYDGVVVDPAGVQAPPPIWVGGRTPRSLRRALELGDGWAPFGVSIDDVASMLDRARGSDAWHAIDVVLKPEPPLDPAGDRHGTWAAIERHRDAGATMLNVRFTSRSLDHWLEQLAALVDIVPLDE